MAGIDVLLKKTSGDKNFWLLEVRSQLVFMNNYWKFVAKLLWM
jgi:hypothetical protein